ncbi:DUF192 domain-containing protein [Candidatus Woesearchaeota archaeon]|nr:DUF192 domain-containing protein [Candidatus Woesearchaeota archaeon]
MALLNHTKSGKLADEYIIYRRILGKAKGLMFSGKLKDKALVFEFFPPRKVSLHMFFVFFPIDVLFVDDKNEVVDIIQNFKPFTFYKGKKKCMFVIELPAGTIKKTKTKIRDKVSFK